MKKLWKLCMVRATTVGYEEVCVVTELDAGAGTAVQKYRKATGDRAKMYYEPVVIFTGLIC